MALSPSRLLSLTVVVVLGAHAFVTFNILNLVIFPTYGPELTTESVLHLTAFSAIAVLGLLSYVAAVMTEPGAVPPGWMPDVEGENSALVQEVKSDGGARFCNKCQEYKPPRCHHCRICKTCVLRMDHHCVWLSNCVGHHNYHSFFLFVTYFLLGCVYALYLLISQTLHDLSGPGNRSNARGGELERDRRRLSQSPLDVTRDSLLRLFTALLVLPLLIALGVLFCWHVYLVLHNKTTIEYHEGVRAKWLAKKRGELYKHPYDLGIVRNVFTIFGPNARSWFWPTIRSPSGDGLSFPTYLYFRNDEDESNQLRTKLDADDGILLTGLKP